MDYPDLADHLTSQFTGYGQVGGTTFTVPDLRGEFLRGSGTNSHANQGSGGSVGEHQDGTGHLELRYQDGHTSIRITPNLSTGITYKDSSYETATNWADDTRSTGTLQSNETYRYTSRPTNTSILYCIKT